MENAPYIVSVAQMQAIEARAVERGLPTAEMMERAGRGVATYLLGKYPALQPRHCLGLIGRGNNGGDALIALTALASAGWQTTALLPSPRDETDPLLPRLVSAGGRLVVLPEGDDWAAILPGLLHEADLILDGLLGTGTRLPLHGNVASLLHLLHDQPRLPPVIALDCPSGVDCDSGEASPHTLQARRTLCIEAVKQGLLRFPAARFTGKLTVLPLNLPAGSLTGIDLQTRLIHRQTARSLLPERPPDAHKGSFGSALILAGSRHYTGAAILATSAALRSGAGLVHTAIPEEIYAPLAASVPEAIWEILPSRAGAIASEAGPRLGELLKNQQALLIGPGLGRAEGTLKVFGDLLQKILPTMDEKPRLVIDADGLRMLAALPGWVDLLPKGSVLTPHPGEMSALTGLSIAELQADRVESARRFSREWGQVVVLKGAFSVIAEPQGQVNLIPVASSALAHGGTGDVLAGMIAGWLAQGLGAFEAATLAAWVHAHCGLRAEKRIGHAASVLAGDLIGQIGRVLKSLIK